MIAKKFKKITTEDGSVKYDPCVYKKDFIEGEIINMEYKELPSDSLLAKKVSFEDLMFAFKNLKPSINFSEVNMMYSFENHNPTPTIQEQIDELKSTNDYDEEISKKNIINHVYDFFTCNYQ